MPVKDMPHRDGLFAAMMASLSFILFVATMAPDLTWAHYGADGGDLAIAAFLPSVPHPTGYPTYLLLAKLFAHLPISPPIRRLTLLSAVSAAAAVGATAWLTLRVARTRGVSPYTASGVASGLLATSTLFWSQAVITEVYALHAFFVAALIVLACTAHTRRQRALLAFLAGTGLGNHVSLALLVPGLLWALCRPRCSRSTLAPLVPPFVVGLAVYALLPLHARQENPLNWGGASTWQGFWWEVSAVLYHGLLRIPSPSDLKIRLPQFLAQATDQFTVVGLALVFWEGLLQNDTSAHAEQSPPEDTSDHASTHQRWVVLTLWTVVAYTVWALVYRVEDWWVYTLPIWVVLAPWGGLGAARLFDAVTTALRRRVSVHVTVVPTALSLVLIAFLLQSHIAAVDVHGDRTARDNVEAIWSHLPPDAILLVDGDRATFGLGYSQFVEGTRADVWVINRALWSFPWYRQSLVRWYRMPGDEVGPLQALIDRHPARPLFLAADRLPGGMRLAPGGPYYAIKRLDIPGPVQLGRLQPTSLP